MLPLLFSEIFLTNEKALKLAFKNCNKFDSLTLKIDKEIKIQLKKNKLPNPLKDSLKFYYGCDNVAIIDEVLGKHLPITFMIVLDKKGYIQFIEILAYRETYGWEIKNKSFLSQFENKTIEDSLRVNKEIKNIAGATISVNSITYAVKRTLFLYENYVKNKIK